MLLWQGVYTLGGISQTPKIMQEKPKEAILCGRNDQGKQHAEAESSLAWI
jgi:hypothetical protein